MSKKKKSAKTYLSDKLYFIVSQFRLWHWMIVLLFLFVFSIALGACIALLGTQSISVDDFKESEMTRQAVVREVTPSIIAIPTKKEFSHDVPFVTSEAVIIIDKASGTVLYAKNEKEQLWPASTTKIMTALIALDEYKLGDIVTVHIPNTTGSTMGLVEGEQITVRNLLYGMLIQSANDAAYALAEHHTGGLKRFVQLMNEKAQKIGLENTHYFDPAGFDDNKQFTTASDLAKLSIYALKNDTFAEIVSIPLITVPDVSRVYFHRLQNVNKLLGVVPGVSGVKTGWTENAKENLINLIIRDGNQILTVVLGSNDRFSETMLLTNWAFENYEWIDTEIAK